MTTTKCFFKNQKGQKICGILDEPNGKKEKVVIIIHGYSTTKNGASARLMSEELTKRGVDSLRIDLNGCGESEGVFKYQTISSTVDDTEAAIMYVKNIGYQQIELFGSSAGGLTAMATAVRHPEIVRMGLKCPVSDYVSQKIRRMGEEKISEWKKTGVTIYTDGHGEKKEIDYTVFDDYKNYVMFEKVSAIKSPTLIIHGDADEVVDIADSKRITNNLPNAELLIIPGANHTFDNEEDRERVNKIFGEWFESGSIR